MRILHYFAQRCPQHVEIFIFPQEPKDSKHPESFHDSHQWKLLNNYELKQTQCHANSIINIKSIHEKQPIIIQSHTSDSKLSKKDDSKYQI